MGTRTSQRGFTLVEVVIVLTVMALLAVAALPRIVSIISKAKYGSRNNVLASIREGIHLQKLVSISETSPLGSYPTDLDPIVGFATCSVATPCFVNVLEPGQGVTDSRWTKVGGFNYQYDVGGTNQTTYFYSNTNGTMDCDPAGSAPGACTN